MGYKDDNYSTKVCGHHPETCTCRDWDTKEEPKQTDQNGKPITYWGGLEEPKQETLEEALEEVARKHANLKEGFDIEEELYYNPSGMNAYKSFIEGAKWQQERMYSEEDMREAFKQSRQAKIFEKDMPPVHNEFEDWFEQFKKK